MNCLRKEKKKIYNYGGPFLWWQGEGGEGGGEGHHFPRDWTTKEELWKKIASDEMPYGHCNLETESARWADSVKRRQPKAKPSPGSWNSLPNPIIKILINKHIHSEQFLT